MILKNGRRRAVVGGGVAVALPTYRIGVETSGF